MTYANTTIQELQKLGSSGDERALIELGSRVLNLDFCFDDNKYCSHLIELSNLQQSLDTEIPADCPHCGKWLSEQ
jgi:hypothetical protein